MFTVLRLLARFVFAYLVLTVGLRPARADNPARSSFTPAADLLPSRGMWSERPAGRWQEALVTGNGTLGAMVFGNPSAEKIILNHERLYEPLRDELCPVPDVADVLPDVRRLYLRGKYKEGYHLYYRAAREAGFPGIQWTDPYHPACSLQIDQANDNAFQQYWRSTDFETGVVAVNWTVGEHAFRRETFASRPDGVMVTRIGSPSGATINGNIRLVNQDSRVPDKRADKLGGGYKNPVIESSDGWLTYRCKYTRSKRGYQVIARVVVDGRPAKASKDGSVSFEGGEALVVVVIQSLEDFADSERQLAVARQRLTSFEANFDVALQRHAKIHSEMMNRVRLEIDHHAATSAQRSPAPSAEALIAAQAATVHSDLNLTLLQQMFDMGRYALISSSGEWPPNLMGIWNGDWRPRWSGDFTLDANVNLQIAGATIGNLPEAIESYDCLIQGLVDDWKTNARNLYGCRGVLSGSRTDGRHNLHTHFSPGFPAVVLESLVYSKPGEIELLPALPASIPVGTVTGVACRNQATVDRLEWNSRDQTVLLQLSSRVPQSLAVRLRKGIASVRTEADTVLDESGTLLHVSLRADQPVELTLTLNR